MATEADTCRKFVVPNPSFNPVEFHGIRMQTGLNSFCIVDAARALGQIIGISLLFVSTAGREAGSSEPASAFVEKDFARVECKIDDRVLCRQDGSARRVAGIGKERIHVV